MYIILSILLFHWIGDFVLQSEWMATKKSISWRALLCHTMAYTLVWIIPICVYGSIRECDARMLLFLPITFCCHLSTDYYTSRVNKQLLEIRQKTGGGFHDFFVSVGFDQMLHYAQLFITIKLLS